VPYPDELPRTGAAKKLKHPATLELFKIEAASDFRDVAISNTMLTLREMYAQGIAADLIGRVNANRAMRRFVKRSHPGGRPSQPGESVLLYLCYVDSGYTSVYEFATQVSDETLQLCGFAGWRPSPSEIAALFVELEKDAEALVEETACLIRLVDACVPGAFDIVFLDATLFLSPSRRTHICGQDHIEKGRCKRNTAPLHQSSVDGINDARWAEVDDPAWGEPDFVGHERTRLPYIQETRRPGSTQVRRQGLYYSGGCHFSSLDWQAGLRSYTGTSIAWFGGLVSCFVPAALGEPAFFWPYPADVAEYDAFPHLLDLYVRALGRYPAIISTDSAYFIKPFAEACTRRRINFVTPDRKIPIPHSDLVDQHGVPRCRGCGGPGIVTGPTLGLHVTGAFITYVCAMPVPGRSECRGQQTLRCDHDWRRVTALPKNTELYQSIAERHGVYEHPFRHNRQRFAIAGKHLPQVLPRPGIEPQYLRIAAALLLLWFRIAVRNNWLQPLEAPIEVQTPTRVDLSGSQHRMTGEIREPGIGTPRLQNLLEKRQQLGLQNPTGAAWDDCRVEILERAGLPPVL
jgi:hypothetical protein